MPEYLAPGVYVEETSFRAKSIEGVSTTTTGFVGPARYGPIDLPLEVITSIGDFEYIYGDGRQLQYVDAATGTVETHHNYLWHAARAFFSEGGKRLYVARVFRKHPDAPTAEWLLHPPGLLWECLQGSAISGALAPWLNFTPTNELPALNELVLAPELAAELSQVPSQLERGALAAVVIRGPLHGGRRTIAGSLARALGQGLLVIEGLAAPDDPRWRLIGPLATVLGALPVLVTDPAPGEIFDLPLLAAYQGPLIVLAGAHGGLRGPAVEHGLGLTLTQNPVGFVRNLVRAGVQGLRQFAGNFLSHLRTSLIGWLTGAMSGANIYIPQAFNLREILKFVLSVLGLTWQNIRQKLVRVLGQPAVAALESTFDLVIALVREGPAAAWQRIVESIGNLRDMVIEQVMTFVRDRVVQAAITRLLTSLNPAGAFIQAIIAIYNTVMFFVERLRQIAQVAMALIDSIAAIASGALGAAANRVEQTMAGLLTLVISFLARIAGLGRVSDAVANIINRVCAPIDRALDRVVAWLVAQARRLGRLLTPGRGAAPGTVATAVFPPIRQAAEQMIRLSKHESGQLRLHHKRRLFEW
ncbi:MAG: hypothetical protein AB4911_06190 [Oscillochloridaceae bacterium umkhey_bin13]